MVGLLALDGLRRGVHPTTEGRFRVFEHPHGEGWLFVPVDEWDPTDPGAPAGSDAGEVDAGSDAGEADTGSDAEEPDRGGRDGPGGPGESGTTGGDPDPFDPVAVPPAGHGDLDGRVADLRPGYLVRATLGFDEEVPTVTDLAVAKRTLFEFVDGASTVFQAAAQAWAEAGVEGEAMNSRVTRSTDGEVNGVLYVFADPPGPRGLFEEFRSAARPLEPLIARVNEAHDDGGSGGRDVPGLAPDGSIRVPTPGDDGGSVGGGEGGGSAAGGEAEDGASGGADGGDGNDDGAGPDHEVFVVRPADEPFVIVYIVLRKGGVLADAMRDTYSRPRPDEPLD